MATANSTFPLDRDDIDSIRHALLVGLASFGEIERLKNEQSIMEMVGTPVTGNLRVIHPTGAADTISQFAEALRTVDIAERTEAEG